MRVLGLNGWPGRGHDPTACLVVDGQVVAMAEEERFLRAKHAYGAPPAQAAAFCLARAGLTLDDVDVVAFGWDIPRLHRDRGHGWRQSPTESLELLLPKAFLPRRRDPELVFVPHHLAHAASAYHVSGHRSAAVLVLDGQGENESASLGVARDGKIEFLETVPASWSLGYFYDAVGQYIGLGADQAGKLMGLAAYGDPDAAGFPEFRCTGGGYAWSHLPPELRSTVAIDESEETAAAWLAHLERTRAVRANPRRRTYDHRTGRMGWTTDADPYEYRDLAAAAQELIERAVASLVDRLFSLTGERTLHLSGGVAFNASLNGKLLRRPDVAELFVQPVAGDAGVALGAAVHVAASSGDTVRPMGTSIAWGADFDAGTVQQVLDATGYRYEEPTDITAATAEIIASGGVVGWFQGRSEVGPRALGHRSILADPAAVTTRDRINLEIKQREWWRPLAPSLLAEHHGEYLDTRTPLPYMVVTAPIRQPTVDRLGAVNHVDGSTRPQTVHAADEPLYHRLISAVRDATGVPVVLNTSFNDNREPVVWSPDDAFRTFARLGMDALAIGPFLVRKR